MYVAREGGVVNHKISEKQKPFWQNMKGNEELVTEQR